MARHLKQNRVLQFRQLILWHSEYCVRWRSRFCFVTAMRHLGHCLVPVSSIHCSKSWSAWRSFLAALVLFFIFSAYSSQLRPRWKGWRPHLRQDSFLHIVHLNLVMSPSSMATRMGQFGVGQARMSAAQETACSRLRASSRSMVSAGRSFLRSHSARIDEHSGQVIEAAPISNRASACRSIQDAQYQPWPQARRTERQAEVSQQQILHTSAWQFSIIACAQRPGLRPSTDDREGVGKTPIAEAPSFTFLTLPSMSLFRGVRFVGLTWPRYSATSGH
mmetsp:Transcript_104696/g.249284  ORF Transcript_104696/g.249284 Transcript_104696/m.249284 type:complete len:276 (-) Transcript_104696:582-1409(-)